MAMAFFVCVCSGLGSLAAGIPPSLNSLDNFQVAVVSTGNGFNYKLRSLMLTTVLTGSEIQDCVGHRDWGKD